jgi:hypothetical protein
MKKPKIHKALAKEILLDLCRPRRMIFLIRYEDFKTSFFPSNKRSI